MSVRGSLGQQNAHLGSKENSSVGARFGRGASGFNAGISGTVAIPCAVSRLLR